MRHIENAGFTETFYQENGKTSHNMANWNIKYNGDEANINLNINDNGKSEKIHMNLSNADIMKLFEINSVPIPLEKRLTNDFLKNKYTQVPLFISNQPSIDIQKKRSWRRKPKKKTNTLRRFLRKLI